MFWRGQEGGRADFSERPSRHETQTPISSSRYEIFLLRLSVPPGRFCYTASNSVSEKPRSSSSWNGFFYVCQDRDIRLRSQRGHFYLLGLGMSLGQRYTAMSASWASTSSRLSWRKGGSFSSVPSSPAGSSWRKPGLSVAISMFTPFGSRK